MTIEGSTNSVTTVSTRRDEMLQPDEVTAMLRLHERRLASPLSVSPLKNSCTTRRLNSTLWDLCLGIGISSESPATRSIHLYRSVRPKGPTPIWGQLCAPIDIQDLVGTTAEAVFGAVDAFKLRSSLTLFAEAAPSDPLLAAAIQRWFRADKDMQTVKILSGGPAAGS